MAKNWLQGFLERYQEAMQRETDKPQMLDKVEKEVSKWRSLRKVDRDTLLAVEESKAWSYREWWPRGSMDFNETVIIPSNLSVLANRENLIRNLYNLIRHIEVVSVVLRFVEPEEFGIMSPPVLSFLCLAPPPNDPDSISYYGKYLNVLSEMKGQYKLERVADVDMALWSAAHLHLDRDHQALVDEMRADNYFCQLLLDNMLQGLGGLVQVSGRQHVLLARVFLKRDYLVAALIAARAYEVILLELAARWNIRRSRPPRGQSPIGALKDRIKTDPELSRLRVTPEEMDTWWSWRNDAVHPDRQITKPNAHGFVEAISDLYTKTME